MVETSGRNVKINETPAPLTSSVLITDKNVITSLETKNGSSQCGSEYSDFEKNVKRNSTFIEGNSTDSTTKIGRFENFSR